MHDISALLDSIEGQTYRNLEVVFVADHCESLVRAVSSHVSNHSVGVRILLNTGKKGVNVCRNLGVQASRGEIVGFVDDDAVLFPDWAEQTVRIYRTNPDVVALTGPAKPLWDEPEKMSWFPSELFFVWGCTVWDWHSERAIRSVGGMNCSFRRDALVRAGFYNPGIGPVGGEERIAWFYPSGEEIELSLRVQKAMGPSVRIVYSPNVRILHRVQAHRFNPRFVLKRCFRFGYTRNFIKHYCIHHNIQLGGDVLQLEYDHLASIAKRLLRSLKHARSAPFREARIFFVLVLGVVSAGLGYMAYFFKPYSLIPREWVTPTSIVITDTSERRVNESVERECTILANPDRFTLNSLVWSFSSMGMFLGRIGNDFERFIWARRTRIPFSHPRIVRGILRDFRAGLIADVGCGDGRTFMLLDPNRRFRSVGLDIHVPSLQRSHNAGAHTHVVQADVRQIPLKEKSCDVVMCLEVCEHLPKPDAYALLGTLERVARRLVVVSVPVGRYPQGPRDGNPFWAHRSSWEPAEFRVRGYHVRGSGLRGLGGDDALSRRFPALKPLHYLLSFLASPISYFVPSLAAHSICYKEIGDVRRRRIPFFIS